MWVQHSVDSHPFRSMSIGHPIPELRPFQNLTLKIKGQGHASGHTSKSQCGSKILSTPHPFRSTSIGHPIPELRLFQNLTLKIKGQGHGWGHSSKSRSGSNILSTHIPFFPCQSGIPFLSYDFFKIWPWKSRVKVIGEVTFQSQNGGLISYRLTFLPLHVNQSSHSWDTAFSKFDLENPGSRSNDHDVAHLQVQTIPYNFEWYKSIQRFQRYGFRTVWSKCGPIWQVFGPWASPYGANGQITMMLHNYISRQVHEKWGKSIQLFQRSGFRKVWTQFHKFLAHGQAHMGQMG